MAALRTTTVRLSAVVPAALSLLSTHGPLWSNTAAAHASIAGGLLRLIQSALAPASRIRHPELLKTLLAPMATPSGTATLLSALSHGPTNLTAKAAGCLYWVVSQRAGDLSCLDISVATVLPPRTSPLSQPAASHAPDPLLPHSTVMPCALFMVGCSIAAPFGPVHRQLPSMFSAIRRLHS